MGATAGTSFRSLKLNHMPDWDKWEFLAFNAKVFILLAWPTWAMLTILLSRAKSLQPSFIGSVSPLTGPLAAGALQLSEKAGSLLRSAGSPAEGHSSATAAFVVISAAAVIATVIVITGMIFDLLSGMCQGNHVAAHILERLACIVH